MRSFSLFYPPGEARRRGLVSFTHPREARKRGYHPMYTPRYPTWCIYASPTTLCRQSSRTPVDHVPLVDPVRAQLRCDNMHF